MEGTHRKRRGAVRAGEALQRLVHAIESVTAGTENVKVVSPMRLRDKDSGRLREHDVVIVFKQGHHEGLIALECRDRSRKVGVTEVEAFRTKCEATGVPMGIIVSSKGFASTAVTKAMRYNIGCLSLGEVEQFNWCLAPGVTLRHLECISIKIDVDLQGSPMSDCMVCQLDGALLTNEVATQWANQFYNQTVHGHQPSEIAQTFAFNVIPPPVCGVSRSGERRVAKSMVLRATFQKKEVIVPFEFRRYFDVAKGKQITDAAIAEIKVGALEGRVVVATEADGAITVSFVPASKDLSRMTVCG
jgi:hypothetical protein